MKVGTLSAVMPLLLLILAILFGCSDQASNTPDPAQIDASDAGTAVTSNLEQTHDQNTPAAGDDFYAHAISTASESLTLPMGADSHGPLTELQLEATQELHRLLSDAQLAESDDLVAALQTTYTSFSNRMAIDARGYSPLALTFAVYDKATTPSALLASMARPDLGVVTPFDFVVKVDPARTNRLALHITQGSLGLPAEAFNSPAFSTAKDDYLAFIEIMLTALNVPQPDERARAVLMLESELASAYSSHARLRQPELTYNVLSPEELRLLAPNVPWAEILEALELDFATRIIVESPALVSKISELADEIPLATWQDYARVRALITYRFVLPQNLRKSYDRATVGARSAPTSVNGNQDTSLALISQLMTDDLAAIYADYAVDPLTKPQADAMTKEIVSIFGTQLEQASWLSPSTRNRAIEKLDRLATKIGYPEEFALVPLPILDVADGFGNYQRLLQRQHKKAAYKFSSQTPTDIWTIPSFLPYLEYSADRNEIVVPAAILKPPFFDPNASIPENFGAMGAMIGHEIWHGFDVQGRLADAQGYRDDWWGRQDLSRYQNMVVPLEAALEEAGLQPALHLDETLGDVIGLLIAHDAMLRQLPASGDQSAASRVFFLSWARAMQRIYTDTELTRRRAMDSHAPASQRINQSVRHVPSWYTAFGIEASDPLYLPPDERLQLW